MPRLNIYLPNDIFDLADKWRDSANLSEICARAIRDEFNAAEANRTPYSLLHALAPPTELEDEFASSYGLKEAIIVDGPDNESKLRECLGSAAATYLDRSICDGALLGLAGGRQMWCMVRNLAPRRIRLFITAIGFAQSDSQLLHAHPNTLATLAWLLYSPRSEAHVIGGYEPPKPWSESLPTVEHPSYFLFASCSRFDATSSLARLLGPTTTADLLERHVVADFAYAFLDKEARAVSASTPGFQNTVSPTLMRSLAQRGDARIVLVAGGTSKRESIAQTLAARLCNMVITDTATARHLLQSVGGASHGSTKYREAG